MGSKFSLVLTRQVVFRKIIVQSYAQNFSNSFVRYCTLARCLSVVVSGNLAISHLAVNIDNTLAAFKVVPKQPQDTRIR